MAGIARLTDRTHGVCHCHNPDITVGGSIVTASEDTFADGLGVARLGDTVLADCGHTGIIVTASSSTITNNKGTARLGDLTEGCYEAEIITASETSFTN